MDSLNREVALIQGPPGTGKTYTGVEFLRVLLANDVKPILMLGFTNHAVDHILRATYEGVTRNIVRLGSRSEDSVIKKLTLRRLRGNKGALRELRRQMQGLEKTLSSTPLDVQTQPLSHEEFLAFVAVAHPSLVKAVEILPDHVITWYDKWATDHKEGFQRVGDQAKDRGVEEFIVTARSQLVLDPVERLPHYTQYLFVGAEQLDAGWVDSASCRFSNPLTNADLAQGFAKAVEESGLKSTYTVAGKTLGPEDMAHWIAATPVERGGGWDGLFRFITLDEWRGEVDTELFELATIPPAKPLYVPLDPADTIERRGLPAA
ncbi:hypothetical protein Q8F55_003317 [Vanrija albida]|uniref:DNA2/NAM7 helicase helicase domain-containing protein n=1 Tax=Vanrija albida TaxID=181172 RepID=A0ABR3Q3K3_9TREE